MTGYPSMTSYSSLPKPINKNIINKRSWRLLLLLSYSPTVQLFKAKTVQNQTTMTMPNFLQIHLYLTQKWSKEKENLLSKKYRYQTYNLIPSSVPIVKLIRYLNSFTNWPKHSHKKEKYTLILNKNLDLTRNKFLSFYLNCTVKPSLLK